ncbi:hypothetical protein SYNPS1DRAFT_31873 [Syncephalis pseudoplumigaleata]|uniref:WD40-repeat-containing domain protein n=1 Tax=Syncephalis pseudoplumigaleata TaxID=1712513 RepID=A0A4P9YS52_9FUNG|nr:hypothetical protein SYNPS1DRAFT_31873 [Syncephalis pseudoplumigaleata]|eukprot:RKP22525.1 hypothetical protein SYNPS1DRAFT_31873 [Syncephalis pseudoplumigaleata]
MHSTLVEYTRMEDGITCMAFTVSFLPHTGNRYFLAACDDGVKLFDFETARVVQTFDSLYSSYCDCAKFVNCVDMPYDDTGKRPYEYVITRGVELLDSEDCTLASQPNSVILHKLMYPTTKGGVFKLVEEKRYQHEEYHSNSWLVKIASNGRFILAPTLNGQVFLFDIRSGKVLMVLKGCEDGTVKVYTQTNTTASTADADKEATLATSMENQEEEEEDDEEEEAWNTRQHQRPSLLSYLCCNAYNERTNRLIELNWNDIVEDQRIDDKQASASASLASIPSVDDDGHTGLCCPARQRWPPPPPPRQRREAAQYEEEDSEVEAWLLGGEESALMDTAYELSQQHMDAFERHLNEQLTK